MNLANSYKELIKAGVFEDTYYPLDFGYNSQTFVDSYTVNFVVNHTKYGIQPFIDKRAQTAREQLDESLLPVYEISSYSDLKIYPNPVNKNKVLYFSFKDPMQNRLQISIWNSTGQKVYSDHIEIDHNKTELFLDDLSSGIYILKGQFDEGNKSLKPSKIIIQ